MTYQERLEKYEAEKALLQFQPLTASDYEEKIKILIKKWRI